MERYLEVIFGLPVEQRYTYALAEEQQAEVGCRVLVPFHNRKLTGFVVGLPAAPPAGVDRIKNVIRVIDKTPLFTAQTIDLARWVARLYLCSHGEALQAIIPGGRREKDTASFYDVEDPAAGSYQPDRQQTEAVHEILHSGKQIFYLNGVTGSGKTEVYLQVARTVLQAGRGVIYLVPEISLTHQVVELFMHRLGSSLAIIHSGLTASQKLFEWMRILKGEVHCVIGARSAVFAPLANLGLIIIDEEHEGSYKSSSTPRYHARQVAMHRCRESAALLVMGSATPSLECYYQMQSGKLQELQMPRRLSGGRMPEIAIVDLKQEKGTLSKQLVSEIRRVHKLGRQTILFLNRRGFAYYFHCRSCGFEMKCRHCSVSLTFHKARWQMVCHYCGYRTEPVASCPVCFSLDVGYSGFGTERIEEEIRQIFPDLIMQRVDTDTIRQKHKLRTILRDFKAGKIDILLGTQMVAKGLNFPGVMLVGIIAADIGLQLPDFRAAERTFALIVQVSGRAGRVIPDSRVIIQTYQPRNPAIVLAARSDMQSFYRLELDTRQELGFPPFVRLIRIVFRAKDQEKLQKAVQNFAQSLPVVVRQFAQILGPVECPLAVIAGNHRQHMIFRTTQLNRVHGLLARWLGNYKKPAGIYLEIDIDPVSLL